MKHLKMLGIVVVAALASMAIVGAGSASATVLCKKDATPCGGEIWPKNQAFKSSLESGTEAVFKFTVESGSWEVKCTGSTMDGFIENAGGAGDVIIDLETLTFTNCGCPVTTLKEGSISVKYTATTMNGSVTTANRQVTFSCMAHCVYGDGSMGTLTGGAMGTIDVNGTMAKVSGSFLCPSSITWKASYTVTAPEPLYVAAS